MSITAPQIQVKAASEERNIAVSFAGRLDTGEVLTGTPLVVEVTSTDLTISNKAVSTASLTIDGDTVPTAEAVQFKVTGGTAGTSYKIKITADTDSSPAQKLIGIVKLKVIADS